MQPKPVGVVPFIDPNSLASLGGGGTIPPTGFTSFSTNEEAQYMLDLYNNLLTFIPGASGSLSIQEQSGSLGYTLNTPYNSTDLDSVGVLVVTGNITISFPPPLQGVPAPPPITGSISDIVGNIYSRYWKPDMEQFDRNYKQSGGATNVNTPVDGKLQLAWGATAQTFMGYWVAA